MKSVGEEVFSSGPIISCANFLVQSALLPLSWDVQDEVVNTTAKKRGKQLD